MEEFFNHIYFRKAEGSEGSEALSSETEKSEKDQEQLSTEEPETEGPSWWESAKSKVGLESEDYYEDLEKQIEAGEIENETAEEVSESAKNKVEAEMEEARDEVEDSVEDLDDRGADTSEMEDLEDELEEFIEETTERIDDIFEEIQSEGGEESKGLETSEETPTTDEVIDGLEEERRTELEVEEESTAKEGKDSEPEGSKGSEQTESEQVNVNAQLEKMSDLYESKDRLESIVEESTDEEEVQAAKDNLDRINNRIDNTVDNLQKNKDLSNEEILSRFKDIRTEEETTEEFDWEGAIPSPEELSPIEDGLETGTGEQSEESGNEEQVEDLVNSEVNFETGVEDQLEKTTEMIDELNDYLAGALTGEVDLDNIEEARNLIGELEQRTENLKEFENQQQEVDFIDAETGSKRSLSPEKAISIFEKNLQEAEKSLDQQEVEARLNKIDSEIESLSEGLDLGEGESIENAIKGINNLMDKAESIKNTVNSDLSELQVSIGADDLEQPADEAIGKITDSMQETLKDLREIQTEQSEIPPEDTQKAA